MTAQMPSPATADDPVWQRITQEVNAWRGACMQAFAQAELAVTQTLLALSATGSRGKDVQLRHLLGQRLEDLSQAIGPDGAFAKEGQGSVASVAAFRTHEVLRTRLAHDFAKIAVQRNGGWVVVLRHLAIRNGRAERGTMAFDEHDAADVLSDLRRKAQRLDSVLADLRQEIARPASE